MTAATARHGAIPGSEEASEPRLATFWLGEARFAVLSVPLDGGAALAALAPAERDVAMLATAALSNAAIAKCRGTSVHTVANQIASILRKLGVGSRYELAARLGLCPLGNSEP